MIDLVKKYLTTSNYKIQEFEEHYVSHPNYPSLLAITDGLSQANVEHLAANIPFQYLEELPDNFITELNDKGVKDFYFLTKKDQNTYFVSKGEESKEVDKKTLEEQWTGISLVIEEQEKTSDVLSNFKLEQLVYGFLIVVAIVFNVFYDFSMSRMIMSATAVIGIIASVEILKSYFSEDTTEESKFCSFSESFSCKSIIGSNSKLFSNYIEFVDLPIIFFVLSYLLIVFATASDTIIGLLSLASLPVVVYSIYSQKFILKKWCLLCLVVSGLLVLNSVTFIAFVENFTLDGKLVVITITLGALLGVLWYFIKGVLKKNNTYRRENHQLLRFKRNEEIFAAVSKKVDFLEDFNSLSMMTIGNPNAINTLTLFLSPSCPHCHKAYKDAKELHAKYPEQFKIHLAYNLNSNNTGNPYLEIAKAVLQLANKEKDFIQALDDWHIERMEMEEWKQKWVPQSDYLVENEQLEKSFQWCTKNEFNYAPVRLFNKELLSQEYGIDELFYFFKEEETD